MPKYTRAIMKLLKILLLIFITTNLHASRIKQDLLSSKEDEITVLLKKKIANLDKLITEAKIYKSEKDPLIQKDFAGKPNIFFTKASHQDKYIKTGTDNKTPKKRSNEKKKTSGHKRLPTSNKMGLSSLTALYANKQRDIFNISMKDKTFNMRTHFRDIKLERKTFTEFTNSINFLHLLKNGLSQGMQSLDNKEYQQKTTDILEKSYETNYKSLTNEILKKYIDLISLLSNNDTSKDLNKISLDSYTKAWSIYSQVFLFEFNLKEDKFLKKKTYDLSLKLNTTFKKAQNKKEINSTPVPSYYNSYIDRNLRCIETAKNIKYKGRICINPIDVDQDIYFNYGVFETRENNFLNRNSEYFTSIVRIDTSLEISSKEYAKLLIVKVSSPSPKDLEDDINLEGGL